MEQERYNQQNLFAARQNMADYKDQGFQLNKVNPYYEQIASRNKRDAQLSQSLNNAGSMVGGMNFGGGGGQNNQQQQTQPQINYQQMYLDRNRNQMNNYNPYGGGGQGGSMYMDGQYGNGLNSMMG